MPAVYLFKFPEYVQLVKVDAHAPNINWPMIQYDTKIFKGVPNSIDFVIRNNDRKPIKLVDYQLQAQIQQVNTAANSQTWLPEVLLTKAVTIIDETLGKARLTLLPEDIDEWNPGYYRYVIQLTNGQGSTEYLYTDVNKNTFGNFELREGVVSSLAPAIEIDGSQFTPSPVDMYDSTVYMTGAVQGDAQAGRANGTHTVAVYQTNWLGHFWVQGSLSNEPPLPSEWFDIPLSDKTAYYEFTKKNNNAGPTLFNFGINAYWLRFMYKPDLANRGAFNKLLYKN
jgi:hypothetical protein